MPSLLDVAGKTAQDVSPKRLFLPRAGAAQDSPTQPTPRQAQQTPQEPTVEQPEVSVAQVAENVRKNKEQFKKTVAAAAGVKPEEVNDKNLSAIEARAAGEEPQEPVTQEEATKQNLIAQAIIGLAPGLIGAALGGAETGAATAPAGIAGLQTLERERAAEQEQQERQAVREQEQQERQAVREQRKQERQEDKEFKLAVLDIQKANQTELQQIKQEHQKQLAQLKGPGKIPKATERQAATFAKRLELSEQVFDALQPKGFDPTSVGTLAQRQLPELLQSAQVKQQEQAERNFVNAVLRRESGAAIAESEFESAEKQYFPRPGDDVETLKQKKINRLIAIQGLRAEAGAALGDIDIGQAQQLADLQTQRAQQSLPIGQQRAIAQPVDFNQLSDEQLDQMLLQRGIDPASGIPVQTRGR